MSKDIPLHPTIQNLLAFHLADKTYKQNAIGTIKSIIQERYYSGIDKFLLKSFIEQNNISAELHEIPDITQYTNANGELSSYNKKEIQAFHKNIANPLIKKLEKLIEGDITNLIASISILDGQDYHMIIGVFKYNKEENVMHLYVADTINFGINAVKNVMNQIMTQYYKYEFKFHDFKSISDRNIILDSFNDHMRQVKEIRMEWLE